MRLPTTISTRSLTGTGLKKWSPTSPQGSGSVPASWSIDNELVLLPMTASGATAVMRSRTSRFRSTSSGTASTTSGHAARAAGSTTTSNPPLTSAPLATAFATLASIRCRAASAASSSLSTTVTRAPATAKAWAMPPPIRPPP